VSTGFTDQPGSREPGLDHLVKALTADGYPHELAGRDAALAAFRAASRTPRRVSLPLRLVRPAGLSWSAQLGVSARLAAVAAALVTAVAGLTAAAYAKALPAPVQHIAYSVLHGVGVPDNQASTPAPRATTRPTPHPSHSSSAAPRPSATSPSAAATCPCHDKSPRPAVKGSVLTFAATRTSLPADGYVGFSGKLAHNSHPEPGVRLLLLEQVAGSTKWQQAGSGVTGSKGGIRLGVAHLKRNATFRLTGPNGVASPAIQVTVIPRVRFWRAAAKPGKDRLVAGVHFGDPGDVVELQERSAGTWETVTSKPLNAARQASFAMPAATAGGHYYRAVLEATTAHGRSVSPAVWLPRAHIGASAIESHRSPSPVAPRHGPRRRKSPHPGGPSPVSPDPVAPSPVQPSPVQPSPVPSPTTGPVTTGPVAPSSPAD
jgi:hypothetical protein